MDIKIMYRSAVSGLWYEGPAAAGEIDTIKVIENGKENIYYLKPYHEVSNLLPEEKKFDIGVYIFAFFVAAIILGLIFVFVWFVTHI